MDDREPEPRAAALRREVRLEEARAQGLGKPRAVVLDLEPERSGLLPRGRADADATQVASMTSSLASLEVQRVVEENPGDLAQYGLDRPRIDVAFRVRGQKEFQRLLIGEKAPAGGDIYAKTPDQSRVFLISSFLDTTFAKTPFDLRDKTVLKFERDRADALSAELDRLQREEIEPVDVDAGSTTSADRSPSRSTASGQSCSPPSANGSASLQLAWIGRDQSVRSPVGEIASSR